MPFLIKMPVHAAAGRHKVRGHVPGAVLIVHADDPPAKQSLPAPAGSTGQDHAGAVTDIGAAWRPRCKGRNR